MNGLSLAAIAAAVAFALGAGSGYKLTADHYAAKEAKAQQEAAEAYQAKTEELNAVSAELEKARHERKTVYRTITQQVERIVTRDVYRNQCVDSDGVSIINAALAGKPVDPGQLDAAVSAAGAATGNDGR
jgi:methylthioribose-1-phosphate isomerase